jgi:DNA replication protein DnaC
MTTQGSLSAWPEALDNLSAMRNRAKIRMVGRSCTKSHSTDSLVRRFAEQFFAAFASLRETSGIGPQNVTVTGPSGVGKAHFAA